jgi:multidrug efflux system membrane fusion protein
MSLRHRELRPTALSLAATGLLALVLLAGCAKEEGGRRGGRVPILVAIVEQRPIPHEIEATGTVEAAQSASITARVGGAVSRISFREGDPVRAGQVLFTIDPRSFQAAVDRAAAVVARDQAQEKVTRLDYERALQLVERQVISAAELDQKRAAAEAQAATVRADQAALAAARLDLSYASVRAPISGRAGDFELDLGDVVRANDTNPVLTIHQVSPIHVRFTVPQDDLSAIRGRDPAQVRVDVLPAAAESTWLTGTLVFVDNAIDEATGTLLLKARFANPDGRLFPGEFVRVRLHLDEEKGAIVLPAVAVTKGQQGTFAGVVTPDTTVEERPLTVERTWRDWVVVRDGVKPGEIVVTDGQIRLSDGAKASIRTPGGPGVAGAGSGAGGRGKRGEGSAEAATRKDRP